MTASESRADKKKRAARDVEDSPAPSAEPAPSAQPPSESAAEWVAVESLHEWKDNPRKNDGPPVEKLAKSIKRFGFASPIIARRANGEIICGHTRWKAAKKLGLDRVPVRFLDLDPADAHLLAIADNRAAEEASWDDAMLAAVLADLRQGGADMADTLFDDKELDRIFTGLDAIDGEEDADVEHEPEKFLVVVECKNEMDQAMLLEKLTSDGFECRAVLT